jgi:hypothetical protein
MRSDQGIQQHRAATIREPILSDAQGNGLALNQRANKSHHRSGFSESVLAISAYLEARKT